MSSVRLGVPLNVPNHFLTVSDTIKVRMQLSRRARTPGVSMTQISRDKI